MNMLEQIYKENINTIYRYSYSQLKNKAEAEDITSYAFMKLLEQKDLSSIQNPKAWLLTVAHNKIVNKYKQTSPLPEFANEMQELIDSQKTNEDLAITEEEQQTLNSELQKLDDIERQVISLKVWEDFKFNEISSILKITESNAKALYYRALQKIKKGMLSKEFKVFSTVPFILAALSKTARAASFMPSQNFISNLLTKTIMTSSVSKVAATSAAKAISTKVMVGVGSVVLLGTGVLTGVAVSNVRNARQEATPTAKIVATVAPSITPSLAPTQKLTQSVTPTTIVSIPTDWKQIDMTNINAKVSFPSNWYYSYQNDELFAGTQPIPDAWDEGLTTVFQFTKLAKDSLVYKDLADMDVIETWTFANGDWKVYHQSHTFDYGGTVYAISIIHETSAGDVYLLSNDTDSKYKSDITPYLKSIAAMVELY